MTAVPPPGTLDPSRHYVTAAGHGGMSEMERKMNLMMAMNNGDGRDDCSDDDDGGDEQHYSTLHKDDHDTPCNGDSAVGTCQIDATAPHAWPPLSLLPIEIVERVLLFAILPSSEQVSQVPSKDALFRATIRLRNAAPLCLVSRQFASLARPQMYRRICIPHRRVRHLLRTLHANTTLVSHVRDVRLDSHIWTSDVNEDVIAQFCITIRRHCLKLRVGANESSLLPYLFHGPIQEQDENRDEDHRKPAAVQVLHICWRDEDDYDPGRIRAEQQWEQSMLDETGELSAISARQTLITLFEHSSSLSSSLSLLPPPLPHLPSRGICMYGNLHHLTLDIFSQAQLDQIFLDSGYFVRCILPLLTFLRIELPISVLQCTTARRGALAPQWPCTRFMFAHPLHDANQAAASQQRQLADIIDDVAERNRKAKASAAGGEAAGVVLAPCLGVLLRSLLTRFALNVHRNDATLFQLLLGASSCAEQIWSTRATIAASILAQSLQRQLAFGTTGAASAAGVRLSSHSAAAAAPAVAMDLGNDRGAATAHDNFIVFPSDKLQREGGVEAYWQARWAEAEREKQKCLPVTLGGTYGGKRARYRPDKYADSHGEDDENENDEDESILLQQSIDLGSSSDIHVSLLLRWPTALDAFFRFAAMV